MVDAIIRLFEDTATEFESNGIGYLPDATSCKVTEERNGEFELAMKYPITGVRYSEIKQRRIIVVKPNPYAEPQPFRIYFISKPLNGIVSVSAEHISYDLSGIPTAPFEASTVSAALTGLKTNAVVPCPFDFWTDKTTSGNFKIKTPLSIRSCLGGVEGSILDVFGTGEYEFDKFQVKFYLHRGENRNVVLEYGKNITDLEQEENCSNVYTGVYPYWYSEEEGMVTANPQVIPAPGTYNYQKVYVLDLSYDYIEKPTPEQLKADAETYIKNNNIGVPKVSLEVSFVHLGDAEEYKEFRDLETVHLCDTVTVKFRELGVDAEAKCIKTVYDCLTNKYDSISLGDSKASLADTVAGIGNIIKNQDDANKTYLKEAVDNATSQITGNLGGYVVLHSSTGGKQPDEILIMDTPDIATAVKVWRWNKSGLGYSSNGYNGPYGLAMTQDGQIVADFIKTGEMMANRISGGTLTMGGINNAGGLIKILNASNEVDGEWDNSGLRLRKNPFTVYGKQALTQGTYDAKTEYAGNHTDSYVNDVLLAREGTLGNDFNNMGYMIAVDGTHAKSIRFAQVNDSSVSASVIVNYGSNPSGNEERFIVSGTSRMKNVMRIGNTDNLGLWRSDNYNGAPAVVVQNGGLYVNGTFGCSGTKNRVVETEHYGKRMMNAMESPEPRFCDFYTCEIPENQDNVLVELDPIFLETVEPLDYHVILTKIGGRYSDKWIPFVEKRATGIVVHGTPGSKYDIMVSAIQKGYAGVRLEETEIGESEIVQDEGEEMKI